MPTFSCLTTTLLDHELGSADSTTLFTSARRAAAIKLGEREFVTLTRCLRVESTITCSNGTQEYNLNSTVNMPTAEFFELDGESPTYVFSDTASTTVYVSGAEQFPQRSLDWLDQYEPGWRSSTGAKYPTAWYLVPHAGQLLFGLYPLPAFTSTSGQSAKVLLPYSAYPSTNQASTYIPFTLGGQYRTDLTVYHQALAHYGAHQLEKLRRDDQASDRQLQKFVGFVTRYLQAGGPVKRTLRFAKSYFRRTGRFTQGYGPGGVPDPYRWP